MPRISRRLLCNAWREHPLLPLLLRPCRDLRSARLELRWLEDHAQEVARSGQHISWTNLLSRFAIQRSRGTPLQYILGTEYFGGLQLKCQSRVLIPRQETAAYITHLLELLKSNCSQLPSRLRVLDLCSGSGCIPLLFTHLFRQGLPTETTLQVLGVDISKTAIKLAKLNQDEQLQNSHETLKFVQADIFGSKDSAPVPSLAEQLRKEKLVQCDILISNPPYISPKQFNRVTARSVRNFEPKLALVPNATGRNLSDEQQADLFYPRLLEIAQVLDVKVLLMEVGDLAQAVRVAQLVRETQNWHGIEIWRDEPQHFDDNKVKSGELPIRGIGDGRSVLCWRGPGGSWLGEDVDAERA